MTNRATDGSQLELGDDERIVALRKAWDRTVRALAPRLTATSNSFLRTTEPVSFDGAMVVLATPSRFAREWLEKRHGDALRSQLMLHLGAASLTVRFVLASAERAQRPPLTPQAGEEDAIGADEDESDPSLVPVGPVRAGGKAALPAIKKPLPPEMSLALSQRYTFENFVVGKSNRLAHAGAIAVAQNPGSLYNPLFIYGSPGLGKTHLLHAIGHEIVRQRPGARIAFVSGESFTNSYLTALREKRADPFRAIYRNVDVWMVDDSQFIAGKGHTKEEFFHTFNTLHQLGRQIILTSDRPPRDQNLMDERLRSRFEMGLIADVTPPGLEMRVAILQQKAQVEGLEISEDVLMYMAGLIQSNIRALEGALIRLIAYASLTKSPVTRDLAQDVLGAYFVERRRVMMSSGDGGAQSGGDSERSPLRALPLPGVASRLGLLHQSAEEHFQRIVETVAVHFGIDPAYIAGDGSAATARRREIAEPRRIAIYLAREKTPLPVTELAQLFGGVNHSAISHAHKKMIGLLQEDHQLIATLQAIQTKLEG